MNKEEKQQQMIDQWNEKFDLMVRERNYWRDRYLKATKDVNEMIDSIERLKNQIYNLSKRG
jgi:flagellar hook-associated protein FlgK